jgi:phospholipid/cholesterol/gamma-HCH transport system substrate-binding protein
LASFAVITLVGVSFVGARYAQLDRLITDQSYAVTAHFPDSGGIFVGAEVTYRGVGVGRVGDMQLTAEGIDVVLEIDKDEKNIPRDVTAVVANRSAVGEQYVDLQPAADSGPYLEDGSEIPQERTKVPLATTTLLIDMDQLVNSINKDNLRTVVSELGVAFKGAGRDLGTIIDTGNAFIEAAEANFDVTAALIKDSSKVLATQIDSRSDIKTFARKLALLSDTFVQSDQDLRTVIDEGGATARVVRAFIAENADALAALINNMLTTNRIVLAQLDGLESILVLYPYAVEGGYTVVAKDRHSGLYNAHFGLVTTHDPLPCERGYESTNERLPEQRKETPLNVLAHCDEPQTVSNSRGTQHAPSYSPSFNRAPVVATYDTRTGKLSPASSRLDLAPQGPTRGLSGADAWAWLFTGGMM